MSDVVDALAALVASLKSAGAHWVDRVVLNASSEVLELDGTVKAETWPMLTLENLALPEDTQRRHDADQETVSTDTGAGTVTRRRWPRLVTVTLDVVLHTRVGFTPSGLTATGQLLAMIEQLQLWHGAHPKLAGHNVFLTSPVPVAGRPTPADVRTAQGQLRLTEVRVERGASTTSPMSTSVAITRAATRTLPDP